MKHLLKEKHLIKYFGEPTRRNKLRYVEHIQFQVPSSQKSLLVITAEVICTSQNVRWLEFADGHSGNVMTIETCEPGILKSDFTNLLKIIDKWYT